ncbi:glucarate dehydratase [Klebsiella pneumoniae]|nr:glucarate dehydratase [Klebsiella pneumoniae]
MTTQSSPIITEMKVIPVAGHDSMLLNIGGAHNAWFYPQYRGVNR